MWNYEQELKVILWDAVVYLKLSFLKKAVSNVYRSWVALVSSVFSLLTTLFSNFFEEEQKYLRMKDLLITCNFKVQLVNNLRFQVWLSKCFTQL